MAIVSFWRKTRSNRAISKRYGTILTCSASLALHIKLADDLSTDSFILAFCRFIDGRGNPQKTTTNDNRTNFVGTNCPLNERLFKGKALQCFLGEAENITNGSPLALLVMILIVQSQLYQFISYLVNRFQISNHCLKSWGH